MRQKFFTTTIQSNFIKNLLLNTALPIHNSINYNDYLIKDNVYLYKTNLLRCTKSGWFNLEQDEEEELTGCICFSVPEGTTTHECYQVRDHEGHNYSQIYYDDEEIEAFEELEQLREQYPTKQLYVEMWQITLVNSFSLVATKGWNGVIEYSFDNENWEVWTGSVIRNSKIYLRGIGNTKITGSDTYKFNFNLNDKTSSSNISIEGNIENLLDYQTVLNGEHPAIITNCFRAMFLGQTALVSASKLTLPIQSLASYCYALMFQNCTNLIDAPNILPALTLTSNCYLQMFYGCASLVMPPKIAATSTATACFKKMFYGCSSLKAAPALFALDLADQCYHTMFQNSPNFKISQTAAAGYDYTFRIPVMGTGTTTSTSNPATSMFHSNGSAVSSPALNREYYATFPTIYPNIVENKDKAETEVITSNFYFGRWYIKDSQIFESNQLAYDSDTHRYLGEYLRFYRDLFGTNLMPFYNCFSGVYTSKFYISDDIKTINVSEDNSISMPYRTVKQTAYDFYQQGNSDLSSRYHTKETFKVLQVPIKFNKKYTIAIECNAPVLIAPAFISNGQLITVYYSGQKLDLTDMLNSPELRGRDKNYQYANLYFNDPIVVEIANRDESLLTNPDSGDVISTLTKSQVFQRYERDLYLLIQLPIENNSSVVVLEGDYTNAKTEKYFNLECFTNPDMEAPSQSFLDSVLLSNLSLLQFNDYTRYPFADRLVEYLLWQVIDNTDEIGPNVSKVQNALSVNLQNHTKGYYDDYLRALVFNTFRDSNRYTDLDNNGNVDKDVEKYLFG